jgi:beta-N-acetylhexosaminidase
LPPTQPVTPAVVSTTPAAAATVVPSNVDIEALLAQMTLEEKVGQMIMAGIAGQAVNATATSLIQQYHIGSIVYFGENTASAEQTLALSQGLQTAAAQSGRGVPLLIAVDHEGGTVFRFRQGLTHFPNLMALGATGSET